MKKKNIFVILIIILFLLVIVGSIVFVITKNGLSKVEKETLVNVEALYNAKSKDYSDNQDLARIESEISGEMRETKENDFKIIEIKKIDEKKLEKRFHAIDKSEIRNEYSGIYFDENGDVRQEEDTTDYTKYNFFAIKYIYEEKMQIAIYIGGYEYNSTVLEDLGIGSWVREVWDMDVYTKDTFNIDNIMRKVKQK